MRMTAAAPLLTDAPQDEDENPPSQTPSTTLQQHCEGEQDPSLNPQSSPFATTKTLTLETPTAPPAASDLQQEGDEATEIQDQQHLEGSVNEEEEDAATAAEEEVQVVGSSSSVFNGSRRGGGGGGGARRKKGNQKKRIQEKKSQERLKVLVQTLKSIPFVPVKTLDFGSHEKLLKRLGLWEFVNTEFDENVRGDLIAQLIASYNSNSRCSYVNGARINVTRADLARALKLPVKKDRPVIPEEEKEEIESEDSAKFVEEFLSTWVLLQGDDTWMMPDEVVEWEKPIRERQFEKLDWAWLFWFMVEKELTAPQLGDCYYASHMQCLIKYQKEDLLKEEPKTADDLKDSEMEVEVEEEDVGSGDVKMADGAADLREEKVLEEHKIELNLGQENVPEPVAEEDHGGEEQLMGFEENKRDEPERWFWNENSNENQHFLRPCSISNVGIMECDEEKKGEENEEGGEEANEEVEEDEVEEEGDKHEGGFPLFPNDVSLDGVAHEKLIASMGDASPISFGSGVQIRGNSMGDFNSAGEFLASRTDIHMIPGTSSLFGNGNKRGIDHEADIPHHSHNTGNKRLRTDEPSWDNKTSDFDMCMGQVQHWIEKARMLYTEKERACGDSSLNQQILLNELHRRDEMIGHLQGTLTSELPRKDLLISKLQNELFLMENVLEGYRKALKETRKAFREHREHCRLRDEPVYKDVKDSRGLVLSTTELEKQRLKQEEENRVKRILLEKNIKEFENAWMEKLEEHNYKVCSLEGRMLELENGVKLLKESSAKHKISEAPEIENSVKLLKEPSAEHKVSDAPECTAAPSGD